MCIVQNECVVRVRATDATAATAETASTGVFADATVNIELKDVNEKPTFEVGDDSDPQAKTSISTPENETDLSTGTDVDANDVTYAATDPEGLNVNVVLMGTDRAMFSLSSAGVLSFKDKPNYEMPGDANRDNVYEVTVRASDGTMHEDRMVMVTVIGVDEPPVIIAGGLAIAGSSSATHAENGAGAVAEFTARGPMADMAMWSLDGDDAMHFSFSPARGEKTELMFRSAPNYEMPRGMAMSDTNTNTYMVTLKADDGENMATHDVTVTVTNAEEMGMVTLAPMNPVVGTAVTATLTDPDGSVTGETWQWSKSMDSTFMDGTEMDIGGAMSMTYTPVAADEDYYLMVEVMYTDGYGDDSAVETTSMAVTANLPPAFDMAETSREVAENTAAGENIGDPVTAEDPNGDTLTYMLGGTDAGSFDIDMATGQLMTKDALDYEAKMSYMVTVTATDPDGEADSIMVTINVTNVGLDTSYDANDDGVLQLDEVYQAVDDYFEEEITLQDALDVIARYFGQTG